MQFQIKVRNMLFSYTIILADLENGRKRNCLTGDMDDCIILFCQRRMVQESVDILRLHQTSNAKRNRIQDSEFKIH